ncbi:MAG: ferrous iron transport protein B [Planctomycetes bacterium]|nr:ferrous iron transport protein B [Planctomycetota bacterium]
MSNPTVALVGNPNTGKTTLFNALAGMNQRVGNYPGVTVEIKKGRVHHRHHAYELLDLPGTYSLAARSPDEMLVVELLLGECAGERRPDVVLAIVDASNLDRNLYLVTQVLELGIPVVVALNMVDVAAGQGITVDHEGLSRRLGVPVTPIQANRGKGLEALKQTVATAIGAGPPGRGASFPEIFDRELAALDSHLDRKVPPFLVRRLLVDVGGYTEKLVHDRLGDSWTAELTAARRRLVEAGCGVPEMEVRSRYRWIREATRECVRRPEQRPLTWTDRIDRVLTHPVWGILVFLLLMFIVFESIFVWAKPLMQLISFGKDQMSELVKSFMSPGPLRSLLTDGIIAGVGGVLVFLPQIMILFAFIAVLEDCGYMARAAYLMDRVMASCGLNGKSFIPLLSSVACAVPGIMATRVIENRRDRLATILVAPLMSCSARLPVYALLIGAFLSPEQGYAIWVPGVTLFGLYLLGLIVATLVALLLKRTLLRGETPVFLMEMPLYKRPSLYTVWQRMAESGHMFIIRAGTLILASMILVWALLYFPSAVPGGGNFDELTSKLDDQLDEVRKEIPELKESLNRVEQEKAEVERDAKPGSKEQVRAASLGEAIAVMQKRLAEHEASVEPLEEQLKQKQREWKAQSWLGKAGKTIEPLVQPLGWDWRVGMAALASFPAREVFVGTMGIIYSQGKGEADDENFTGALGKTLQVEKRDDGGKAFTIPVVLSIMVFFALCCQCASTLAVIKRETNSWFWPAFTFVYMTVLAYLGALVVYQAASWIA